ncbi:MAG TPA: ribonuclease III [Candidatus Goldiibacteriota bacterium]|nr:ribonuclease III [Candidatus Goldiibacteriota bacterium]
MAAFIENYLKKSGIMDSDSVKEALTHKSADSRHYEKLEFLGDSVLGLVVSEYLYKSILDADVGELARIKGYLVSRDALFNIGKKNNASKLLKSGSTLKPGEIKNNKKIMSDIVESVIGAIYLTEGFESARNFILEIYKDEFRLVSKKKDFGDYKSGLQMKTLAMHNILPEYRVVKTEGKEHRKIFHVEVMLKGLVIGKGRGMTIKEAEQMAAKKGLEKISKEEKSELFSK